jgi:cell division control protein 6
MWFDRAVLESSGVSRTVEATVRSQEEFRETRETWGAPVFITIGTRETREPVGFMSRPGDTDHTDTAMGLDDFTRSASIFADETVLRDDYNPEELIERDQELAAYQNALQPVVNSAPPKNIFVYGQTGTGKTQSTRLVLDKLTEDVQAYDDLDIATVRVVCKSLGSSYKVAVSLVNELRPADNRIARTGHAAGDVYDMLWEEINALEATHVLFVLDEIDSIGTDDEILYELPRCSAHGHVTDTYVGVIGISNDFTFRDNLSARVQDSLCDEEIHFAPYDANQLKHILAERAADAFLPGVVEEAEIGLAAAFAAQESGSARRALNILYKAGDLARQDAAENVTEAHVRTADDIVESGKIADELRQLPVQNQLVLAAIHRFHEDGETPVRRNQIYETYVAAADTVGADVKTNRTVHNQLSQLSLKGFLEVREKNEGVQGGKYYLYDLSVRAETVTEAFGESERLTPLFG